MIEQRENIEFNIKISMIYRAKVGLQSSKQIGSYSPMHSPSNQKKGSVLKQSKFSPKPLHRENKENIEQKQPKTDRGKEEKYFKISKDDILSSSKKPQKPPKISISISLNDKSKNIEQFDDLNLLNIQTPKFKCSSNKVDDRCKTEHFNQNENYFSFGEDFRENVKLNAKQIEAMNFPREKKSVTPLKERNKLGEQEGSTLNKNFIDSVKKRQKFDKLKQGEQKLEQRLTLLERQMKESKFKKDRQIFCFRK